MKKFLLLIIVIGIQYANSQQHVREIDEQVWKPFIEAFKKNDIKLFRSLHSPQLIRVQQTSVIDYPTYMNQYERTFGAMKEKMAHLEISFRFTRRLSDSTRAFEEGYYKTTSTLAGNERPFYGKFTVLHVKESGKWRLLMDSDTNEGMSEAVFLTGKPIE